MPGVNLTISQALRALTKNQASKAVVGTFGLVLGVLGTSSLVELYHGAEKVKQGSLRGEILATVDYLRVQVSCVLSLSNLLILLLNLALSAKACSVDRTEKNLTAMQRQVKGLQTEYERVTKADKAGGGGGATSSLAAEEAAALKKTLDRVIGEKEQLQAASEAAEKAAKAAEAKVTAMVSQIKGYDKEFDRMLDENKALKARLAQQAAGAAAGAAAANAAAAVGPIPSKKDD
ncbi:hypothetical protein HXX76_006624 [Chlamydomonas incerta]|uniref:Endoplasmic reticulum transmembrane protein n=1 Tax=Chlamydomonas incerta TaxID=51695 RepID=A0A835SZZ9_CHLIN|nr:hypothetical protein HXX76_006624 [Chlamydomonas incerta]|eukprot:KAG2436313.1 hypothetical protein HXX76_006624 [Chlamydomonas incerta]